MSHAQSIDPATPLKQYVYFGANLVAVEGPHTPPISTEVEIAPGSGWHKIIDATNTGPIVIRTATPHNFTSGEIIHVWDVLGNEGANGYGWEVNVRTPDTLELLGISGNGAYAGGGIVAPVIYAYVRPIRSNQPIHRLG